MQLTGHSGPAGTPSCKNDSIIMLGTRRPEQELCHTLSMTAYYCEGGSYAGELRGDLGPEP